MGFFKKALLVLWMCLFCASSSHAVPLTSPEIEAAKERVTQEVRDLTPVGAAIKHAADNKYRFFSTVMDVVSVNARSGAYCASGAVGVTCREACYLGQQGEHGENGVLGEYNMALLALPNSPYAKGCVPNDKDAYQKIQQQVMQELGMTQESYDAARQEGIEKYRILDIAFENDLAALESYRGELNVLDVSGRGALYYAVEGKNLEMFSRLLKMGIDTTSDKDFFKRMVGEWSTIPYKGRKCYAVKNSEFVKAFIDHAQDISTQDTAYYVARAGGFKLMASSLKKYPQEKITRVVQGALESCAAPEEMLSVLHYLMKRTGGKEIVVPMETCWASLNPLSSEYLDVLDYLSHMGVRVIPSKNRNYTDGRRCSPAICMRHAPENLRNQALEMFRKLAGTEAESPPPPTEGAIYVPNIKE